MKADLATSIVVSIVGIVIAYFVCQLFVGPIENFTFTTIDSEVSTELAEPDSEIFNYKALNPTVEVYVGTCKNVVNGVCADETADQNLNENS